jgi:hypothetical protein
MPDTTIDDTELATLRANAEAGTAAAAALEQSQRDLEAARAAGVSAVTDALRAANADLPADAIAGATIEEVNASAARARAIAQHVLGAAAAATPPPSTTTPPLATAGQASAPPRTTGIDAGLRGTERIRAALNAAKKE